MQAVQGPIQQGLGAALAAVQAGAWADALRLAGSLIASDPLCSDAHEVISMARRALEVRREGAAERRQMTILFADVAGSTALLTRLGGETYRDLMLELHQDAAKAVGCFGGRIAQYLGDGILAYFSYPQAHEDDAQRAVYAGLELLERMRLAASGLTARFGSVPALRLGIDTGPVVIGAAGAGEWTTVDSLFGDPPHVAARLQSLAPPNAILISDSTRLLVERYFVLEALGDNQLAGYAQPLAIHRVVRACDGPRPVAGSPTLIDRDAEVAQLETLWAHVRGGGREELLLVGEAGVGKSLLVEHLANVATATGARVVAIHCSAAFRYSAFYPVAAALRRLLLTQARGALDPDELRAALVRAGVPDDVVARSLEPLSSVLDIHRPADVLPDQLRAAVFAVLIELFERLAKGGPLLIVVEDLHMADDSTAQLLASFRERSTGPMLLVATVRSTAMEEPGWRRRLQVAPLGRQHARALALRSAPTLDEHQVDQVIEAAAGVPLFLIDSAHGLTSGAARLPNPSATRALLTHRLDLLDDDSRTLVSELSVLGTACPYPLLAAVSELPTERLERALARLLHDELLMATASSEGSVFQLRHRLYQEVAYDGQLQAARTRRHARCADALMAQDAQPGQRPLPELIADHLTQGGRSPESVVWWQRSGDRALNTAAYTEAVAHFGRALDALSGLGPGRERDQLELGLQLAYGASCSAVFGYADSRAARAYTRASELGAAVPDAAVLLPALWGIWSYNVVRGAHGRALELTQRCLGLAGSRGQDLRAVVAAIAGAQYVYLGRWAGAVDELRQAIHASGPAAQFFPQNPALASRALLAIVEWVLGDETQARRELHAALSGAAVLSGRQGDFTRAYVHCFAAWFAQLTDEPQQALEFAQHAVELSQRHNFQTWLAAGALHVAGALTALGDYATGLPLFESTLAQWQAAGAQLLLPYFFGRYGHALVRAGHPERGLEVLNQATSIAAASGEVFYDAELHRLRAEALAARGAPPGEVTRELEAARQIASIQQAAAFERRALTALAAAPRPH